MAATFGAATQATFTAMVFVFELTRDYDVVLPLMLATVVADLVYSSVVADSLMTEKLRRRGLLLGRHYGVDPFTTARVRDVMSTDDVVPPATSTVDPMDSTQTALRIMVDEHVDEVAVVQDGVVVGRCTLRDLLGGPAPPLRAGAAPARVQAATRSEGAAAR